MLANLLGEENLLGALNGFLQRYRYQAVTTADLLASLEEETGEDLDWFFNQWLYGAGYPSLDASTDWDEDARIFRLELRQVQPVDSLTGIFRFPLQIETTTASGANRHDFLVDEQTEHFLVPLDERPVMVIIDRGLNVLKSLSYNKTRDEYLYQLANAREGIDRLDACEGVTGLKDDEEVLRALGAAALNDPFWAVRVKAVNTLGSFETEEGIDIFTQCLRDPDSRIRSAAVDALGSFPREDVASLLETVARDDSSYLVLSTCIRTLARIDSVRGFMLAAEYASTDSYRDMIRSASLNALRRLKDPRALPIALGTTGPSFETSTRLIALGILEDMGRDDATAVQSVSRLAADPNLRIRHAAVRTLAGWGDDGSRRVLQERRGRETDPQVLETIEEALKP